MNSYPSWTGVFWVISVILTEGSWDRWIVGWVVDPRPDPK